MDLVDSALLVAGVSLVAGLGARRRPRRRISVGLEIVLVGALTFGALSLGLAITFDRPGDSLTGSLPFLGVTVCLALLTHLAFALRSTTSARGPVRGWVAALIVLVAGTWLSWRECLSAEQLESAIMHERPVRVGRLAWLGARVEGRGVDLVSMAMRRGNADVVRALVLDGRMRLTERHLAVLPVFEWRGSAPARRWLAERVRSAR